MLVFIDMDGVVSDFDKHMFDMYGKSMEEMTEAEKNKFWDVECVALRFFADSPAIPEGLAMVSHIKQLGIEFAFLTSTGGQKQHTDIAKQKLDFLKRNGFDNCTVTVATGTKAKASYASVGSVLIDDREKVVEAFRAKGGTAHLFTRDNWKSIVDLLA